MENGVKNAMWFSKAIPVFFLSAALLLAGCVGGPGSGKLSYMEVAFGDQFCPGGICQDEHIVLSNGLLFSKTMAPGTDVPSFAFGAIAESDARGLISKAIALPQARSDCTNCPGYHVFASNGQETRSFKATTTDENLLGSELEKEAKRLKASMKPAEAFFAHVVYWKAGENIVDYHVFSDGSVLKEFFDKGLNVVGAQVYSLSEEKAGRVKSAFASSLPKQVEMEPECTSQSYVYAYFEAYDGATFSESLTCGAGDSAPARAYKAALDALED